MTSYHNINRLHRFMTILRGMIGKFLASCISEYPGMKRLPLVFNIMSLHLDALSPSLFQFAYPFKLEVFIPPPSTHLLHLWQPRPWTVLRCRVGLTELPQKLFPLPWLYLAGFTSCHTWPDCTNIVQRGAQTVHHVQSPPHTHTRTHAHTHTPKFSSHFFIVLQKGDSFPRVCMKSSWISLGDIPVLQRYFMTALTSTFSIFQCYTPFSSLQRFPTVIKKHRNPILSTKGLQ